MARTAAALVVGVPAAAAACPVCFSGDGSPMADGSNMGILALLLITVGMLSSFAAFFLYLMRRARLTAVTDSDLPSGAREGAAGC